ncbi:synaptopodin 2-like protein [Oncorhynchus keta]|uniref:synaptopodin 2-like protein n=1 Tax=Oncorhynchus keta TaxID=8018 RepID=UPI0015FAA628|nr:synaptopodin 2-like protein [Oncorhynchus keta]
MVSEEVVITLSGGAPWGFRLQGGVEHQKPLQVAKVRKRSKACRAGLREGDELVSINDQPCGGLSHAQAMTIIDNSPGILHIQVKRAPAGFQSVVLLTRAPSPRIDKEYRATLRAMSPSSRLHHTATVMEVPHGRSSLLSPMVRRCLTSPPGSEAYYGETDSDAEVAANERQRRQKHRNPSNLPGKAFGRASPEGGETSEFSGYDSAPDARVYPGLLGHGLLDGRGGGEGLPGVARREVIHQPPPGMWSSQTSTETSSIISSVEDQVSGQDRVMEEDRTFQEPSNVVPLVSPERAKEAMQLSSRRQMVPMVGPIDTPLDEELSVTYMDKAKQAKLNRGDTVQDKKVKEARTKCRSIASLLTDAPNPNSKGVLMFKKRRQRSKKYTLTSFGSVDEDMQHNSPEEDGLFPGSESEFDEDGFSAAPDTTWDSDYLDALEKRATAGGERGDGAEDAPSPGLSDISGKGAQLFEQQRKRAAEHAKKVAAAQPQIRTQSPNQLQIQEQPQPYAQSQPQPKTQPPMYQPQQPMAPPPPVAFQEEARSVAEGPMAPAPAAPTAYSMANGDVAYSPVSTAGMVMSPLTVASNPITTQVSILTTHIPPPQTPLPELSFSSVLNRTARPFNPGFVTNRAATAPVVFRPVITKSAPRPATSVSIVGPPFSTSSEPPPSGNPAFFSPPSSVCRGPFSTSASALATHPRPAFSVENLAEPPMPSVPQASFTAIPPPPVQFSGGPIPPPPGSFANVPSIPPSSPFSGAPLPQAPVSVAQSAPAPVSFDPIHQPQVSVAQMPQASVSVVPLPNPTTPTPILRSPISKVPPAPGGRTGILLEARRRSGRRPMFQVPAEKKNSPNPDLLNMVQNLDDRPLYRSYSESVMGFESGKEEDQGAEVCRGRMPPLVAPKPRVIHEAPQIPQEEGKGAQLFARRQSRMDRYVVDTPQETAYRLEVSRPGVGPQDAPNPNINSQWKLSPNIRAPPPIGYNPLLAPSCPVGPQRDTSRSDRGDWGGKGGIAFQREGIKALDFMRRQPYQLNSAMFGGSVAKLSAIPSYQDQRQQQGGYTTMVGSTMTPPRQIPVKAARVYEIKRFSTPTPMSAPSLAPTVIAPRSATTLGERLTRSDMISPTPAPLSPPPAHFFAPAPVSASPSVLAPTYSGGLPGLPRINVTPVRNSNSNSIPAPYPGVSYSGLQGAKQFQSAPELSFLANLPTPLRANAMQAPKPRFIATKVGVQPCVWRPGAM